MNLSQLLSQFLVIACVLCCSLPVQSQKKDLMAGVDSLILIQEKRLSVAQMNGDSSEMVEALKEAGRLNHRLLNYADAMNQYSQVLALSEWNNDTISIIWSSRQIGEIYRTFRREDEALDYFIRAKELTRQLVSSQALDSVDLMNNHLRLASILRNFKRLGQGEQYLDSAAQIAINIDLHSKEVVKLNAEKAHYLYLKGHKVAALDSLLSIEAFYDENKISELSPLLFVYSRLGNIYEELGDDLRSEAYYKKGIDLIDSIGYHFGQQLYLFQNLSEVQYRNGRFEDAFSNLKLCLNLYAKYFNTKGETSQRLFDIRSEYIEEIEENKRQLVKQDLVIARQENEVLWTRSIAIIIALILVVSVLLIWNKWQRIQAAAERKMIKREADRKEKKTLKMIDQKNRELTSFTLKLIEKDSTLSRVRDIVEKCPESEEKKEAMSAFQNNSMNNWDEFNERFVAVNPEFYERLTGAYPSLSSNDLKLSALIKLNFSTKEMSQLLGISQSSVNMARYRLRAKMNLQREDNLTSIIASI